MYKTFVGKQKNAIFAAVCLNLIENKAKTVPSMYIHIIRDMLNLVNVPQKVVQKFGYLENLYSTHTHTSVDLPIFYYKRTYACAPEYGFSCIRTREAALLFHARMCATERQG